MPYINHGHELCSRGTFSKDVLEKDLPTGVTKVPDEIDYGVASMKLDGIEIDSFSDKQSILGKLARRN